MSVYGVIKGIGAGFRVVTALKNNDAVKEVDKPAEKTNNKVDTYDNGDDKVIVPKVPDGSTAADNIIKNLITPLNLGDLGSSKVSSETGTNYGGNNVSRPDHKGIDISYDGIYGDSIYAAGGGTVIEVGNDPDGYGNYVVIDHGNGVHTLYAHCSDINVNKGDPVTQGQKIGEVGNSGRSSGPHLHFEVRKDSKPGVPLSGTPIDPSYLF